MKRKILIAIGAIGAVIILGISLYLAIPYLGQLLFSSTYNTIEGSTVSLDNYKVDVIAEGLVVPWHISFVDNNNILVTERGGTIRIIREGKLEQSPVFTVPDVTNLDEAGLMGMTSHPNFNENKQLYLCYSYGPPQSLAVKVVQYNYQTTFVNPKTIIDGIPGAGFHAGCRIKFGPDGKLYITTGDASNKENAQNLNNLGGKTLRLNDDGTTPSDNPFFNTPNARKEIWSYGHRNSQGLAWDNNGVLVAVEHGPSGFDGGTGNDEVNIIEKGKNYGWPIIQGYQQNGEMVTPVKVYERAIAPGSTAYYDKDMFPEFKGYFIIGALRGRTIVALKIENGKVVDEKKISAEKFGRIRHVVVAEDGSIYFSTSNRDGRGVVGEGDDKVYRISK
jgi:glucose/arabinose dehydrogenase